MKKIILIFYFTLTACYANEQINALDLFVEYNRNQIATSSKYNMKVISVKGVVREIGNGRNGNPFIKLDLDPFEYDLFICNFSKDKASQFEKLSVWNEVVISGIVTGVSKFRTLLGTFAIVEMVDCNIEQSKESKLNIMLDEWRKQPKKYHE